MSEDLIVFLRNRLDEDVRHARSASPAPWHADAEAEEVTAVDGVSVCDVFALSNNQLRATTHHITRHDPARVLAEVAAKRRIVDEYERLGQMSDPYTANDLGWGGLDFAVKALASPHADHPDYREEWRP